MDGPSDDDVVSAARRTVRSFRRRTTLAIAGAIVPLAIFGVDVASRAVGLVVAPSSTCAAARSELERGLAVIYAPGDGPYVPKGGSWAYFRARGGWIVVGRPDTAVADDTWWVEDLAALKDVASGMHHLTKRCGGWPG